MAIINFTVTPGVTLSYAPDPGPIDLVCSSHEHRGRDFMLFSPAAPGQPPLIAQLNPLGDSDIITSCAVRDEPPPPTAPGVSTKFQMRKLQMQAPALVGTTAIRITFADRGPGGHVPDDIVGHSIVRRKVFTIDLKAGVPSISPANAYVQSHDLLVFERGTGTTGKDIQVQLTVGTEPAGSPAFVACAVANPAGFVRVINIDTTAPVIAFSKKGGGDPPGGWPDS